MVGEHQNGQESDVMARRRVGRQSQRWRRSGLWILERSTEGSSVGSTLGHQDVGRCSDTQVKLCSRRPTPTRSHQMETFGLFGLFVSCPHWQPTINKILGTII